MNKISLLLIALCSISFFQLTYADSHETAKPTASVKCEGLANTDFSLSYLDANKDGMITKEEYLAGDKSNTEKTFKHIDANDDGKLDAAEQKDIQAVYKSIHDKYNAKNTSI